MAQPIIFDGELRSSTDTRIAHLVIKVGAEDRKPKRLTYAAVADDAIFEGDIVLGSLAEVQRRTQQTDSQVAEGIELYGLIIPDAGHHWDKGIVPFEIDPALPNRERVEQAIVHWMEKTKLKFVKRVLQGDYVVFRPSDGCSSNVGKQGGTQFINLGPNCSAGNAIHEIGHTVGLWHEQSRSDRDYWVQIDFTNIIAGMEHNFDQHISDGKDIGTYDYGSIMHYPPNAFAKDPTKPTLLALRQGAETMGQRNALSAGDTAAVARMYGAVV